MKRTFSPGGLIEPGAEGVMEAPDVLRASGPTGYFTAAQVREYARKNLDQLNKSLSPSPGGHHDS